MTTNCLICLKEFKIKPSVIKRGSGKYCSRKCRYSIVKSNICSVCKIQFNVYKNGHKNIKFCSYKCNAENKKLNARIIKNCKKCGKEIVFSKWENKKYCSVNCANKNKIKMPIPIKYCEVCNNQLKMSPMGNITYFKKKRFCSPHCKGIYNAAPRKIRNPKDNQWQRWLFKRDIEKQVFKRDNYACQICGDTKTILHVDHIQRWADYIEGRFDINNCRTVCRICHYLITFGKPMPINSKWGTKFPKGVQGLG